MHKYRAIFVISALLITQSSFANTSTVSHHSSSSAMMADQNDDSYHPCKVIVKSCLKGGYSRGKGPGKAFWHDCMKPALLGQTVEGVKIDSKDAMSCKDYKIKKMKKELEELQQSK